VVVPPAAGDDERAADTTTYHALLSTSFLVHWPVNLEHLTKGTPACCRCSSFQEPAKIPFDHLHVHMLNFYNVLLDTYGVRDCRNDVYTYIYVDYICLMVIRVLLSAAVLSVFNMLPVCEQ